jgi:hypothetical protein
MNVNGSEVVVEPGVYTVNPLVGSRIRLNAQGQVPLFLEARATTHPVNVEEPQAIKVPGEDPDLLHIVLLLPNGQALDAAGSLSGTRSRGVNPLLASSAQIQIAIMAVQVSAPRPTFAVVSYGGKCLDFGAPPQVGGGPVFIYGCNGTIAQQIEVQEINDRHEVILRAGTKVLGVKGFATPPGVMTRAAPLMRDPHADAKTSSPPAATSAAPSTGVVLPQSQVPVVALQLQAAASITPDLLLELQDEQNRTATASVLGTAQASGQIFVLDGDSIILAADRTRVVKVQNNRGVNRTPLVLGPRDLADAEFWTFVATDKSNRKPTSGFVRVPQEKDFVRALTDVSPDAHPGVVSWGTVIEVDPTVSINLTNVSLRIPDGVTIRSNRRGPTFGGELWSSKVLSNGAMLEIAGNGVRITGLRLRGPTTSLDGGSPQTSGLLVHSQNMSIVDHNDISQWTVAAVNVTGDGVPERQDPRTRPINLRVSRNFIHHNAMSGLGYGVVTGNGGYLAIEGNTFIYNRHAIAGDGTEFTGYRAWSNLVQYPVPLYGVTNNPQQDFDMHGTENSPCQHCGGIAGTYMEIARNTFLGGNRENFFLRGTPTFLAEFHHNVCVGKLGDVIKNYGDRSKLIVAGSEQFEVLNPTARLGVGDFDGDGTEDLFLATGAGWYYAPQANAEWRFLNAQTAGIGSLMFGDFDGDGRTDVFTQQGRDWLVSWAGASAWEKINESNPALSEFRIGDFDGDRRADVFYADGQRWWVSYGGSAPFINTQDSSFRVADLGFGDFNGDGKTDVIGVVSGKWMVSLSATGSWVGYPLRAALTSSMTGLVIADFNGNGRADVATAYAGKVSYDGRGDWVDLPARPGLYAAVGRFDARPGVDIVFFWTNAHYLGIQSSGVGTAQRQSRQEMR